MPNRLDDQILIQFEEYLSQKALSPSTIVNYLADLRAFKRWASGENSPHFSLLNTTQEHIRGYRHYLAKERKRAVSTVNRHLMSLRKFFAFTVKSGAMAADPTAGVALISNSERVTARPLTADQTQKLLDAAQTGSRAGLVRRDVAILTLLLHTGLRVSEVVDLQTDDLIFDNPGLHLRVQQNQRNGPVRNMPLPGELCRVLDEYLQIRPQSPSPHLFLSQEGRPISTRTVQRIITDCAREANLKGVSAQALRRTFAAQLFAKTQDLALVSKRLGHQNTGITEQYLAMQK